MKRFEIAMIVLAILSLILQLFHIPGGTFLMVISATLLSLFYYVLGFALFNGISGRMLFKKESYQNMKPWHILGAIVLGWTYSTLILGMMFKVLLLPGASMMLIVGLGWAVLFSIVFSLAYFTRGHGFTLKWLKRALGVGIISLGMYLIPANAIIDITYSNDPEYAQLLKEVQKDPDNEELRKQLEEMEEERRGNPNGS